MEQNLYLYFIHKSKKIVTRNLRQSVLEYVKIANKKFLKLVMVMPDNYEDDNRISIAQYNKELDESIAHIENWEYYTHEEMGERIKKCSER